MRNVLLVIALAGALGACGDDDDSSDNGVPGVPNTPPADAPPSTTPPGDAGGDAPPPAAVGVPGCEAADTAAPDTHQAALDLLMPMTPCGFGPCHTGGGKAGLVLTDVTDLNAALVDVASCEAPTVPLVDGSGGDAALNNSWLWIKMVGAADTSGVIEADPAWGEPANCGQEPAGTFGVRMPLMSSPDTVNDDRLATVRNWICAGAPAP